MDTALPLKVGDSFMENGSEFEITLVDSKKKRISATKKSGDNYPQEHEHINIDNSWYYVFYINTGQKRISMNYSQERN